MMTRKRQPRTSAALRHITMPRVFFPGKGELASDSEMLANQIADTILRRNAA